LARGGRVARLRPAPRLRPVLAEEHLPLVAEDGARLRLQLQCAIGRMVDADEAHGEQLPEDRLPDARRDVLAGAEDGHVRMAEALRLLVLDPHEDIDDMAGAEALAGAVDRGERLDGRFRAVPGLDRVAAGVAIAAVPGMALAEMGKD